MADVKAGGDGLHQVNSVPNALSGGLKKVYSKLLQPSLENRRKQQSLQDENVGRVELTESCKTLIITI